MNLDYLSYIMAGISLLAAVCSAIATVNAYRIAKKSLDNTVKEQLAQNDREKKQATLDAYNNLQVQVCDRLNSFEMREIRNGFLCNNRELISEVNGLIARIEHFCVGLELDIYDKETFYELAHGYFDEGILRDRLDVILTNKDNSLLYYEHIFSIWAWMKKTERERNIVRVYKVDLNPEVEMLPEEEAQLAREHSK